MSIGHTPRRSSPTWAMVIGVAIAYANVAIALVATLGVRRASVVLAVMAAAVIGGLVRLYRPPRTTPPAPAPPPAPERRNTTRPVVVRELPPGTWPDRPLSSIEGYTEDLDLTVWVGRDEDGDRVLERRTTRTTTRTLSQRELTLISPYAGMDTGKFSVEPRIIAAGGVEATWMAEDIAGRGTVNFTPPIQAGHTLEWSLDYPPAGFWNPLREDDIDVFRYDVRKFPIGRFTVTFRVHKNARTVFIQERDRNGVMSAPRQDAQNGEWVVSWRAGEPTPSARFEFDVRADWGDPKSHR